MRQVKVPGTDDLTFTVPVKVQAPSKEIEAAYRQGWEDRRCNRPFRYEIQAPETVDISPEVLPPGHRRFKVYVHGTAKVGLEGWKAIAPLIVAATDEPSAKALFHEHHELDAAVPANLRLEELK